MSADLAIDHDLAVSGDLASAGIALVVTGQVRTASPASDLTLPISSLSPPVGANDRLLLVVSQNAVNPLPTPSGWTLMTLNPNPPMWVFAKLATAAEPTVVIPIQTNIMGTYASATLAVYRGVDPASPVDAQSSAPMQMRSAVQNTITFTASSIVTTHANDRAVAAFVYFSGAGHTWSSVGNAQLVAQNQEIAIADQPISAAGPTGPLSAAATFNIINDSQNGAAWMVALQAAP